MENATNSPHPIALADLVLAAMVQGGVRATFLNPVKDTETYALTFEKSNHQVSSLHLEAGRAAALVARLAVLAKLDLTMPHVTTGVIPVRSGDRCANVLATLRPGHNLSIDLIAVPVRNPDQPAPTEVAQRLINGQVIGHYQVIDCIGEGGMGQVYRVRHVSIGREYALKILRSSGADLAAVSAQFLQEACAAARVHHPNIVDVFDFGHVLDGRPYLVMEFLQGKSLRDTIAGAPLSLRDAVQVARALAAALAAAHARGIVHSDVTPSNVIFAGDQLQQLKLVDFGLARFLDGAPQDGNLPMVAGTPYYMAPEQIRGVTPTVHADQYSYGALLFELLSGSPPFLHQEVKSICLMHLAADVPTVTSPHGELPAKLVELVTRCLQKRPENRFTSMEVVIEELTHIEQLLARRGWRRWLPQ